jgi:DNA repair protein RecN (Recombination protein N)
VLQKLHIVNYAIITEVEIDFTNGFNIITGETGAGKSILLGALSLILGERADVTSLFDKDKKCIIEGIFTNPKSNHKLHHLFVENEIEIEEEIIIRREIAANGKSRAFVNDTPTTLNILKKISAQLVDLHQQFDNLELGEQSFQREVIDSMAKHETLLFDYQKLYKSYNLLKKEIEILLQLQADESKTYDYNKFLYDELAEANLQPNEIESLEGELKLLNNVEQIKTTLSQITNAINNNEEPILQQLKQLQHSLKSISQLHKSIEAVQARLQACIIELDDISSELEQTNDTVNFDAEKIETITDKINVGNKLLKKHNVQSTEQLLDIQIALENKLLQLNNAADHIELKNKELAKISKEATLIASQLHQNRIKIAPPFAQQINTLLKQIGMPNAAIKIEIHATSLNENGSSVIEFLFDANKSNRFEPVAKVASGGELSRLMLCIKSLVADAIQLPVLIFDEIDTGISGEAARQVGLIMSSLSTHHQVLCITHQAQIAAKANTHYFVYKSIEKNSITTGIKILTQDERITTIAQMLSGEKPTAAALQNAREMVSN